VTVPANLTNVSIEKEVRIKKTDTSKYFEDMSVLHTLISLNYIQKHKLKFDEETSLFTDLNFIIPIIDDMENIALTEESIYYKRTRNDPITNPSLQQLPREKKVEDFLSILNKIYISNKYQDKSSLYLQRIFINYYCKEIIMLLENTDHVDLIFD